MGIYIRALLIIVFILYFISAMAGARFRKQIRSFIFYDAVLRTAVILFSVFAMALKSGFVGRVIFALLLGLDTSITKYEAQENRTDNKEVKKEEFIVALLATLSHCVSALAGIIIIFFR